MNENIDLTKILKDCPKGTKLYSKVHGEVEFAHILDGAGKPIVVIATQKDNETHYKSFTAKGCLYSAYETDECLLVPSKNQQDWSKFSAPWYNKEKDTIDWLKKQGEPNPYSGVSFKYNGHTWGGLVVIQESEFCMNTKIIDWLNENHFDYRGLIKKSLALDATGLNIY